jgi:pimeloyl-ACP methyl ester carboxylesterase
MPLITDASGMVFAELTDPATGPGLVVALHGWGRDRRDLIGAVGDHRALAVDLPGFGTSPPPPVPWGSADYAAAVGRLLEERSLHPAVLVGHSFGGRVAVVLAADRPDLVSGLVVIGTPLLRGPGRSVAWSHRLARYANRIGLISDDAMEARRRRHGSADYRAATGVMRQVLVRVVNEDYADHLGRVTAPTAFCWGEDDTAAPVPTVRRAWELVGNPVSFDVVAGSGHDVHLSRPERVRAAIDAVVAVGTTS